MANHGLQITTNLVLALHALGDLGAGEAVGEVVLLVELPT